jgi:hypothetical protein
MMTYPSSDESFTRLHRAGWSVGDVAGITRAGRKLWLVTGTNGENEIRSEGATQNEAWSRACEQAAAVAMLGRGKSP